MTSLNRQDVLDLISQTDSASDDGMSSDEEEYLNLAWELCLEFRGKYFNYFKTFHFKYVLPLP